MHDTDNKIFEPDVVLSAELFPPRSGLTDPERMLMIAVLEDAVRCLLRSCTAGVDRKLRALYEETHAWFCSSEQTELYDFENVCAVLGIEADWLRGRILRLAEARRAEAGVTDLPDAADSDPRDDEAARNAG